MSSSPRRQRPTLLGSARARVPWAAGAAVSDSARPLGTEELESLDAYWRAANYLSVGQIYLLDNPLLREPLSGRARQAAAARPLGHDTRPEPRVRARQPGHQGPRSRRDLVVGPGPWRPGRRGQRLARGHVPARSTRTSPGTRRACGRLFRQFSFPGGIGSHVTPETPGSIHEGGELGYALVHAFGAAFDNPDLVVFCVVGDGEAETGPLAASWHSNKFLDPAVRRRRRADPRTSTATRSPTRRSSPGSRDDRADQRCSRATATGPIFVEGDDRRPCTS